MPDEQYDWWNAIPGTARWLIIGALLSGLGSGAINVNKPTDDRYRGADAKRDFAEVYEHFDRLERRIDSIESYRREHDRHATKYTEKIEYLERNINKKPAAEVNAELKDLRARMHDLEKEVIALERRNGR